jgi:ferredoxin
MREDAEGFLYPEIENEKCTKCGLCEKICPALNQGIERKPLHVYAAKNTNEAIRMASSSGGIFTLLAEAIINEGGVVFGARFNERWEVIHDYTETIDGLAAFRGSKYVQSRIGDTYTQARDFLVAGPIERSGNLLPQFYVKRRFDYSNAVDGSQQILWGLFKKVVIADNCAVIVNIIFDNYRDLNGGTLLAGAVFFSFQIYGDFSGYSDIAIGTAKLFGIRLMRNFAFSYFL